ncbi:hypothetical protein ACOSP7_008897 [Xanthoceras sorbifolium]
MWIFEISSNLVRRILSWSCHTKEDLPSLQVMSLRLSAPPRLEFDEVQTDFYSWMEYSIGSSTKQSSTAGLVGPEGIYNRS